MADDKKDAPKASQPQNTGAPKRPQFPPNREVREDEIPKR